MAARSPGKSPLQGSQRLENAGLSDSQGWGKETTKTMYSRDHLKNDPLLKTLQGKITVDFDYKPWQRTSTNASFSALKKGTRVKTKQRQSYGRESSNLLRPFSRPISGRTVSSAKSLPFQAGMITVGRRPVSAETTKSACSSICAHPWNKKPPFVDDAEERRRQNVISIMKSSYTEQGLPFENPWRVKKSSPKIFEMQIRVRQKSIAEYRDRKEELLSENITLADKIIAAENNVHVDVKDLLQMYEKFRGAMSTLSSKFKEDLVDAKKSLSTTQSMVKRNTAALQHQVDILDARLQKKQEEVKTLLNYKDKEYPVKALRIAKLRREKENLAEYFEEELEELEAIVDAEKRKFSEERLAAKREITSRVTEKTIGSMNESVKNMALQNMIMKKEIEIHRNEVELLEENNNKLEKEIRILLDSQELNAQAQMFPSIFAKREKCLPDMELELDIPTQEWLPI